MNRRQADIQRLERYSSQTSEYRLAIITDEDRAAQIELEDGTVAWGSTLMYGRLKRRVDSNTGQPRYELEVIPPEEGGELRLLSLFAEGGRGAEFSELAMFGDRLMTFDDRTGLVCEIRAEGQLVPRQILMAGSGDEAFKGFKSEWATLYGDELVVGSHGRKRKPGHPDECVGLKSIEIGDRTESFLFCFDLNGKVLQEDTYIGPYKCEGIEIL